MPDELAAHILSETNLVLFDFEITGQRLLHWRYLNDSWRILSDAAHTPRLNITSPPLTWISACWSNLAQCTTEIKLADLKTLTFARRSTIGFSALEIELLANWFELTSFPHGVNSIFATNPAPSALIQRRTAPTPPSKP